MVTVGSVEQGAIPQDSTALAATSRQKFTLCLNNGLPPANINYLLPLSPLSGLFAINRAPTRGGLHQNNCRRLIFFRSNPQRLALVCQANTTGIHATHLVGVMDHDQTLSD